MHCSEIVIGIDLGGTQLRVAAINCQGVIVEQIKMLTAAERGHQAIITDIRRACLRLMVTHSVAGIGIVAPGPLDADNGVIYAQPTLPDWDAVPIKHQLETELGLPVVVENDANGAALGEALLGAGAGRRSVFYITVSTGVGGGFVHKGELISGAHNCAGEIANMIITDYGAEDGNLNRGALESLASGTALGRQAQELGVVGSAAELLMLEEPRLSFIDHLSTGVANVIHTLDPELIVFGGGVMNSKDLFWEQLIVQVNQKLYPYLRNKIDFAPAALEGNAGILGAAVLIRQSLSASGAMVIPPKNDVGIIV